MSKSPVIGAISTLLIRKTEGDDWEARASVSAHKIDTVIWWHPGVQYRMSLRKLYRFDLENSKTITYSTAYRVVGTRRQQVTVLLIIYPRWVFNASMQCH